MALALSLQRYYIQNTSDKQKHRVLQTLLSCCLNKLFMQNYSVAFLKQQRRNMTLNKSTEKRVWGHCFQPSSLSKGVSGPFNPCKQSLGCAHKSLCSHQKELYPNSQASVKKRKRKRNMTNRVLDPEQLLSDHNFMLS